MNRQVAFAYAIAGLAVAVALITVVGSSVGLFETRVSADPADPVRDQLALPPEVAPAAPEPTSAPAPNTVLASTGAAVDGTEVVYVDAPAPADDDGDDDDRYERGERHHRRHPHREDDDD